MAYLPLHPLTHTFTHAHNLTHKYLTYTYTHTYTHTSEIFSFTFVHNNTVKHGELEHGLLEFWDNSINIPFPD